MLTFDEFTGEVQPRLALPGTSDSVRAIWTTLMTLDRRIPEGDAEDLAASRPVEITWYLTGTDRERGQRDGWQEFVAQLSPL